MDGCRAASSLLKPVVDARRDASSLLKPVVDARRDASSLLRPVVDSRHDASSLLRPVVDSRRDAYDFLGLSEPVRPVERFRSPDTLKRAPTGACSTTSGRCREPSQKMFRRSVGAAIVSAASLAPR